METINLFLVILVFLISFYSVWKYFSGKLDFIEFPLLFSLATLGWFFPQIIAQYSMGDFRLDVLFKGLLMANLCFLALNMGYFRRQKIKEQNKWTVRISSAEKMCFAFCVFCIVCLILLNRLPDEMKIGVIWTGIPVIYLFFASGIELFGLLALIFLLNGRKNIINFMSLLLASVYFVQRILFEGRRSVALTLFFSIMGLLYFYKGFRPPKYFLVIGTITFALFSVSVGDYRSIVVVQKKMDISQIKQIEWLDSFKAYFQKTNGEVKNYIYLLNYFDENNIHDYGFFQWNRIVDQYIPRQIFGSEIKESFKYPIGNYSSISETAGYDYPVGQTSTGMLDAFESFWFFGCLEFFIIGYFMKWLYIRARNGEIKYQLFYFALLTPALETLTHETAWLTIGFINVFLFTFPIFFLYFKRRKLTT